VVVGCGSWSREVHLPFFATNQMATLKGVVDSDTRAVTNALRNAFSIERVERTIAAFDREAIDAVVISTPHSTHFALALECLRRGLHVHVDKPIALLPDQVDQLIRTAEENAAILSTHTQRKYFPGQTTLRWYLHKYFRKIYHVSGSVRQPFLSDYTGSWRADPAIAGGGILMDSGYHVIDTALSFLHDYGSPLQSVNVVASNANQASDCSASLLVKYRDTAMQINAVRGTPTCLKKEEYQILGDGGSVRLSNMTTGAGRYCEVQYVDPEGRNREVERPPMDSAFKYHPTQLFLQCVQGDAKAKASVQLNVKIARNAIDILSTAYKILESSQ